MNNIVEIFHSLQSEGYHAGRSAMFVRFYGCNLKCNFGNGMVCDEPKHVISDAITEMSDQDIVDKVKGHFVVITGGEPTLRDLNPLITMMKENGCYVAVETNGYKARNISEADWITWSPKYSFAEDAPTDCERFDELKVLAGIHNPLYVDKYPKSKYKYVQPIADGNHPDPFNTTYCVDFVKANPSWRLSIQFHKYLGLE